jgi:prepilin-type processing-associated H-X9-DG protein
MMNRKAFTLMHYRHSNMMNVAYMDGHAKATKQFTKIAELGIR